MSSGHQQLSKPSKPTTISSSLMHGNAKSPSLAPAFVAAPDEEDELDEDEEGSSEEETWISWFCSLKGNEYFCQVDVEFILDRFNLTGLGQEIPKAQRAYDLITDNYSGDDDEYEEDRDENGECLLERSARHFYGLVHQRFIITPNGLAKMHKKYLKGEFGSCPRVLCRGQHLLPVGLSDLPGTDTVKLYCPHCEDVYQPCLLPSKRIGRQQQRHTSPYPLDGAFWGTTFPHLFFQTYRSSMPNRSQEKYIPRIFGFRLAPSNT